MHCARHAGERGCVVDGGDVDRDAADADSGVDAVSDGHRDGARRVVVEGAGVFEVGGGVEEGVDGTGRPGQCQPPCARAADRDTAARGGRESAAVSSQGQAQAVAIGIGQGQCTQIHVAGHVFGHRHAGGQACGRGSAVASAQVVGAGDGCSHTIGHADADAGRSCSSSGERRTSKRSVQV